MLDLDKYYLIITHSAIEVFQALFGGQPPARFAHIRRLLTAVLAECGPDAVVRSKKRRNGDALLDYRIHIRSTDDWAIARIALTERPAPDGEKLCAFLFEIGPDRMMRDHGSQHDVRDVPAAAQ